ncbi:hypothetical protein CS022_13670 [Veronia nyctiphanis]|uniref:Calx-beta domain-containing protein n=1 Tax=Veronia nyctiphanis TaxID=1278244 RepID=A0A4Q0YP45_9GAMM|nr:hypothetical protein CS022_13670 [Veronia nyctiphanis]
MRADGDKEATVNDEADKPTVTDVSDASVTEGQEAVVTVTLSNTSTTTTRVFLDAYNGQATGGGVDYNETLFVDFGDGQGWRDLGDFTYGKWVDVPRHVNAFNVKIGTVDNGVFEPTEQFTLHAKAHGQAAVVGTITIMDNDLIEVTSITKYQNGVENVEGKDRDVGWELNLSQVSNTETVIKLNINDNQHSARVNEDYSGTFTVIDNQGNEQTVTLSYGSQWVGEIVIPPNTSKVTLLAETLNDDIYEGMETLTVNALVVGSQTDYITSVAVGINDASDKPKVESVSSPDVSEGDAAIFDVIMTNQSTTSTVVTLELQNGAATAGTDFNTGMTVSFDNGATWQAYGSGGISVPANTDSFKVRVNTIEDHHYEKGEKFSLIASSEYELGKEKGTATIVDDELIPRDVNGLWDVEDVSKLTLEMQNIVQKLSASNRSSLGYYLMDSSGNIIKSEIMMAKVADHSHLNFDVYLSGAAKMGLFLIPNGATYGFKEGSADITVTNNGSEIRQNGKFSRVVLSESHKNQGDYDNEKNNNDHESFWEDMFGGGDKGHDDVRLNVVARPKAFVNSRSLDLENDSRMLDTSEFIRSNRVAPRAFSDSQSNESNNSDSSGQEQKLPEMHTDLTIDTSKTSSHTASVSADVISDLNGGFIHTEEEFSLSDLIKTSPSNEIGARDESDELSEFNEKGIILDKNSLMILML